MGKPLPSTRFAAKDGRQVLIRPFAARDLDAMTSFVNRLVKEKKVNRDLGIGSFDKRATKAFERKFLRSMIESERKKAAVTRAAFADGMLVGESTLRRREQKDMRHGGLFGIVVLDGYRGLGIGEKLMSELLRGARDIGVWFVELEVIAINRAAIGLYKKMGFRTAGVLPGKILRDDRELDIVVMYADLRDSRLPD